MLPHVGDDVAMSRALSGEIPPSQDEELRLIAEFEPADPLPDDPVRKLYRSRDKRDLVLAEHRAGLAYQVGGRLPRALPREVAAGVCTGSSAHVTDPTALLAVSMGLIDALVEIDRLKARCVELEARAGQAETDLRANSSRASDQGRLL